MDNVLANPQTLTQLALMGLVAVQVLQLLRSHLKARTDAATHQGSLADILQKVLDQQTVALERLSSTLAQVKEHMHADDTALGDLTRRLEQLELHLGAVAPPPSNSSALDEPQVMAPGPSRERKA